MAKKKKRLGSDPLDWIQDSRKKEEEPLDSPTDSAELKKTESKKSEPKKKAEARDMEKPKKALVKRKPTTGKPKTKSPSSNSQSSILNSQLPAKMRQFCSFWVCGRMFGIDIQDVKEVNRVMDITKIHHASPAVKGLVNIRGQINLVLNLRQMMGFQPKETDNHSRIVIFKPDVAETLGILVDKVGDVVEVEENSIEPITGTSDDPQFSNDHLQLYTGVCKLEKDLMVLLNAGNFKNIQGAVQQIKVPHDYSINSL